MFIRIVLAGLISASLAGVAAATSSPVPAHHAGRSSILLVHEGHGSGATRASGTVNAVDVAQRKVNLSHSSIKALGWPAMTMDFPVSPDVNLAAVKPGMRVNLTLVRGNGGMVVDTIQPTGGGQ